MKPYEKYVPSGVEWIGDIPEGWEIKKLKYISYLRNVKTEDSDLVYIALEHIESNTGRLLKKDDDESQPDAECLAFYIGDVLFCKLRPYLAKCVLSTFNGKCSSELLVLQSKIVLIPQYLFFVALSHGFLESVNSSTYGSKMPRANWEFIGNMQLPLPSPDTQTAIADYLDCETARIDKIIKAKETLIERLKEKRISVITHAVTKGLDHNAKMKSSGVEWIGDIPEGWAVKRLKYVAKKIIDGTHATPEYISDGIPFLRVTDISSLDNANFEIKWDEVNKISTEEHHELIKRCNPQKGDLLVSKNGTIGVPKIVDWDDPFSIFVSLCLIKLTKKINVAFLYYYFLSSLVWTEIAIGGKTGTITNLHLEKIKEFAIPFPPLTTQTAIANYLDTETAKIDAAIAKTKLSIEKLKEYRTALISACVTGKIDVRNLRTDKEEK